MLILKSAGQMLGCIIGLGVVTGCAEPVAPNDSAVDSPLFKKDLGPSLESSTGITIIDLGSPTGLPQPSFPAARAINKKGVIAGREVDFSFAEGSRSVKSYRWTRHGGWREIGTVGGGAFNTVQDNNDEGHVVGAEGNAFSNCDLDPEAPYWKKGPGRLRDLSALLGATAIPRAINNRGHVAGVLECWATSGLTSRAFFWERFKGVRDLGALRQGDDLVVVNPGGMNNHGDVVGGSVNVGAGTEKAFYWRRSTGQMEELEQLDRYIDSEAFGVNDYGETVGAASTPHPFGFDAFLAVLWTEDGHMVELDPDGIDSRARAINNRGHVVGEMRLPPNFERRAVVWTGCNESHLLGVLPDGGIGAFPDFLSRADAINEHGQIAGLSVPSPGDDDLRIVVWEINEDKADWSACANGAAGAGPALSLRANPNLSGFDAPSTQFERTPIP